MEPLLSPSECRTLVTAAEQDEKGWKQSDTGRYGTAAHRLPALFNIVDVISSQPIVSSPTVYGLLSEAHFPVWEEMLHSLFAGTSGFAQSVGGLRLKFARIVKYRAQHPGERSELGFHQDGPLLTCNIALNEPEEYKGGGTAIQALLPSADLDGYGPGPGGALRPTVDVEGGTGGGSTVVLRAGHALVHPGHVRHAGHSIQSGERWLLGLFFDGVEHTQRRASASSLPAEVGRVLPSGAWLMRDGSVRMPRE